jgi:tetratricopeptide (TPR) repeat protein
MGRYEEAVEQLRKSDASDWDRGKGCNLLGISLAYFRDGRLDEARSYLKRAQAWCKSRKVETLDLGLSEWWWPYGGDIGPHDRIAAQLLLREAEELLGTAETENDAVPGLNESQVR